MSSWWLGFTRDLHPDPSTAKKVPQLPRISKPKSFKNNFFSVESFIHWRSLKGTIVTLRRKIWDLWGKGGVFVFLTFWVFKASRKKPGLTIHTQRTVVICQIQKAIATVNANAASWKVREPKVLGGSFRQGPKKHPAGSNVQFLFCYRLWKKGKTNGISTLIWTLTAKTHLAKNPNEGFGCQNPTKTNPSLLSFWFCRHYLDVLRTHSTRTPTLGTVQRNTSASLLRSRLLASGCGHGTRDASNFPLSLEIPTEFSPQTKHIDHVSAVFGPLEILKLSLCHGNMSQQSNIASSLYSRLQPSSFCCVVWGLY